MLVTVAQLQAQLHSPQWLVVDCRHDLLNPHKGRLAYEDGHIPQAHFVGVDEDLAGTKTGRNGRHPLPAPAAFAAVLARLGVTPETTLVAYDDAGGLYAARLWWMARSLGHEKCALLDGGLQAWVAAGLSLSVEIPAPRAPVEPLPAPAQWPSTADAAEILADCTTKQDLLVVDARAAERYRGEVEPIDPVGGHIPGAVNHFYKLNLGADLRFKTPEELRTLWTGVLQGRPPGRVVHQCGSGITACANLFALERAGLSGSRIYPGSWSEWVSDPSRPVAKGNG